MRGGPVRLALYTLLVLLFLLLPPPDPAVASPYDPPIINGDDLDRNWPNFPQQANDPPNVGIDLPDHGREYILGDGIRMVFVIDDPDDSEWLLSWEVSGLNNGYFEDIDFTYVDTEYTHTLYEVPVGEYHLSVYVWDQEFYDAAAVEFMVVTEYTEPTSTGASPWWYGVCCFISFLVIVPISYYLVKRRQASVERSRATSGRTTAESTLTTSPPPRSSYPQVYKRPPLPPPLPKQVPSTTPAPYPMGSGKAEPTPAYASRNIEPPPPPPPLSPSPLPPPPPPPPPRGPTPAMVEDWRVGSVEEFVDLIEGLPEGFPEPLWGIDWWTLGKKVVSTSEMGSDGQPVCTVNGRKFHADKQDLETFMQEVED